jgi:hypothetical protein
MLFNHLNSLIFVLQKSVQDVAPEIFADEDERQNFLDKFRCLDEMLKEVEMILVYFKMLNQLETSNPDLENSLELKTEENRLEDSAEGMLKFMGVW